VVLSVSREKNNLLQTSQSGADTGVSEPSRAISAGGNFNILRSAFKTGAFAQQGRTTGAHGASSIVKILSDALNVKPDSASKVVDAAGAVSWGQTDRHPPNDCRGGRCQLPVMRLAGDMIIIQIVV